jgi:hypothetical protein
MGFADLVSGSLNYFIIIIITITITIIIIIICFVYFFYNNIIFYFILFVHPTLYVLA